MKCKFCKQICQKAGKQKNGTQKLYCTVCKKYQQSSYRYSAYNQDISEMISMLLCESVCIRGIARVLKIAVNTVLTAIRKIAASVQKPPIILNQQEFEVDELRTYIGRKENEYWIAYALNKTTGKVVDFIIGKCSKRTLRILINTLLLSGVKRIFTDNLSIYKSLVPKKIHTAGAYCINHIERKNLDIRTHLKRLSRRTICFSRSYTMLDSCMKIYFWGQK